ncbi:hypothetical protein FJ443_09210 [Mesorhizobium sp. B2-6-1]|nr:hypothetical protein FJ443_09210 [Mesorhizobium sp. B2-6-1]
MQKLNPFRVESALRPASREPASAHSLSPRLSSSPARAKREADCPDASAARPVRPSPAAGTAGAAAPRGSGPQFSAARVRSLIRTEDGTVILLDRLTGRAVSAPDRVTAEARLARLAALDGRPG